MILCCYNGNLVWSRLKHHLATPLWYHSNNKRVPKIIIHVGAYAPTRPIETQTNCSCNWLKNDLSPLHVPRMKSIRQCHSHRRLPSVVIGWSSQADIGLVECNHD